MIRHTVFTPTFNRIKTLPRVYDSLKQQIFKEFVWLIIDDGSTDGSRELIEKWINEKIIRINYIYKENGGKHTAMKLAYDNVNTKYITGIDSDDELKPDILFHFDTSWRKIEEEGLENSIAQVKAFTIDENNKLIGGNSIILSKTEFIDITWHELVLKRKCYSEFISCSNVSKIRECIHFEKYGWHKDSQNYLGENILWSAIGRKYRVRVLNQVGRIYYSDDDNSLLRKAKNRRAYINELVNFKYFLDENHFKYFIYNPRFYISYLMKYIAYGLLIKESQRNLFTVIESKLFRIAYIFFFPASFFYYLKLKNEKVDYKESD